MSKRERKLHIDFNSPIVLSFTLICTLVMAFSALTHGKYDKLLFMTYRSSLADIGTYLRLFTHVIGHAGWDHLLGNLSLFLIVGPLLEEKYGSVKILIVIALTAVSTGLINALLFPGVALCGASGVVFAFILLSSITNREKGKIPITFILVACYYVGEQIYEGIAVNDNISNMAHIVGGIVGATFGFLSRKKKATRIVEVIDN